MPEVPIVTADNRVLYSGPSAEDAVLVYNLARELGAYRRKLGYFPDGGTDSPAGACGKIIAQLEAAEKRKAVAEALRPFRIQAERLHLNGRKWWDDEPSPEPPKVVVKNLLAASSAEDFETARREWEYRGEVIYEGESGFAPECELCGPKELMRTNYVIHNVVNGNRLRVGSVCVKRFLVLVGAASPAESADVFDRRTKLALFGRTQADRIADLGKEKIPEKSIVGLLGALEKAFPFPNRVTEEDAGIILRAAGAGVRASEVFTALVTGNSTVLRGLKVQKMLGKEDKRRRIAAAFSTLSWSSAYRNPAGNF